MALIICPECGKQFSDTAQSCPHCGYRSGKYAGKSKGGAILLAIFLGGLGIHKFYLGKNGAGVLYLLFCWTFIPLILSILDAIGLLFTSKDQFGNFQAMSKRQAAEVRFEDRLDESRRPPELLN